MFNLSTIHIFIPVRGCVGRGPNAMLCLERGGGEGGGAIMLLRRPCREKQ